MRALPVTLALSLAVHGALAIALVVGPDAEPRRAVARVTPSVETIRPAEAPPFEVALLSDDTVPGDVTRDAAATFAPRPRTPARIASGTVPAAEVAPPGARVATPARPSMLSMRRGPDLALPEAHDLTDAQIAAMVDGTMPTKIQNVPGAQADADLAIANARLANRKWTSRATGDEITAVRMDRLAAREAKAKEELVAQKDGTFRSDRPAYTTKVDRDGRVHFQDKKNLQVDSWFPPFGHFDITDALMRKYVGDPYAADKLAYLDRTRDQRYEVGKVYRAEALSKSDQHMLANLDGLWRMTKDVTKRKEGVFDLWDECAETGDAELVAGGAQARALLERWVQVKLVGTNAYTAKELATLNAHRRSKQVFAPYLDLRPRTPTPTDPTEQANAK